MTTGEKSIVQLVEEYLDDIEKFRTSDPDKYLEYLKMLRDQIEEGLSKFSRKQIEEATAENHK